MRQMFTISFEEVVSMDNLCEAWQEFIKGKRNKKDVQEFMMNLSDGIVNLHTDLADGQYRHGKYQHFRINDPKPRDIHKATVRDRLLHHAIHRKLYPLFAKQFIFDSFSCQTGKGLHRALVRFKKIASKVSMNNSRTCWILKCDIRKFFASIDHELLINILQTRINDDHLMGLLKTVIQSFENSPGKGIPLGNLTSQLFANIYMNEFDQYVKHELRAKYYLRYADDFVFMSYKKDEPSDCLPRIKGFLSEHLKLELHPNKVSIKTLASGADFLGWVLFPHHRVPRTKTKKRMFKRIKSNPKNEILQSYLGLLGHGDAHRLRERFLNDFWLYSGT